MHNKTKALLGILTKQQRIALTLRYSKKPPLTYAQIGGFMGISSQTAWQHVQYAEKKLRKNKIKFAEYT